MKINRFNHYGIIGLVKLIFEVIVTKTIFLNARIIRLPIEIRGKRFIKVSQGLTAGRFCRIEALPQNDEDIVLKIGRNVQLNDNVHITAMSDVTIGDNVLMASRIYISDCTHGFYSGNSNDSHAESITIERNYEIKSVLISNNVWLGEGVCVLPGVHIGENSIIGANSVVTKNIPANSIAVGNPAKVIKQYNFILNKWEKI